SRTEQVKCLGTSGSPSQARDDCDGGFTLFARVKRRQSRLHAGRTPIPAVAAGDDLVLDPDQDGLRCGPRTLESSPRRISRIANASPATQTMMTVIGGAPHDAARIHASLLAMSASTAMARLRH